MRRLTKNIAKKVPAGFLLNERLTNATGIVSLVVACGSLGIAWWSLKIAKDTAADQHRQLVEAQQSDRKTAQMAPSFLTETNEGGEIGIYVENNGMSPARLDRLRIYVDNKPISGTSEIWAAWGGDEKLSKSPPSYHEFNGAKFVRPGDRWSLLFFNKDNIRDLKSLQTMLRERTFMIGTACDMYSRCAFFCTKGTQKDCDKRGDQLQSDETGMRSVSRSDGAASAPSL